MIYLQYMCITHSRARAHTHTHTHAVITGPVGGSSEKKFMLASKIMCTSAAGSPSVRTGSSCDSMCVCDDSVCVCCVLACMRKSSVMVCGICSMYV